MARILICCMGLLVSIACADDAAPTPTAAERFLDAIGRGDLALVRELAATVTKKQVPNLLYQAPGSPNPEVVEFLRRSYELRINDLQIAAIRGDRMVIRRLLAQLDERAKKSALSNGCIHGLLSHSPLALAVRKGHTDAVRELISAGAEVNEYCIYTLTPLANAAERGHTETVKLLLQHGAKVDAAPDAYTALMRACIGGQCEAAKLLLDAGADSNAKHDDGQRPLHFAAKSGSADCVDLLLKHGADASAVAYERDTALTCAERYNHKDVVQILRDAKRE